MRPERLALLAVLGAVAVLATVWLFVPVFRGPEAARRHLGTHRLAVASLLFVLFANALLTIPLADDVRQRGLTLASFVPATLATQLPMLALLLLRLVLPGAVTWSDLGLRPISLPRAVGLGLLAGVCGLGLTVILGLILGALGLRHNQREQFAFIMGASPSEMPLILLLGAVAAPFVEELFFRGFLFGTYLRRQPAWVAYTASGLLFALVHANPLTMDLSQALALILATFCLGTLFAWTYRRTGSLVPGMVAHGFNNLVVLSLLYFARQLGVPS